MWLTAAVEPTPLRGVVPGPAEPGTATVQVLPVTGLREVGRGDDLAFLLTEALAAAGTPLRDGDVLAVASKVCGKAAGLAVPAAQRADAVRAATRHVVARRAVGGGTVAVVRSAAGPVMAAAGVDASNTPAGTVLPLPEDCDAIARTLRAAVRERTGARIGVLITDTVSRPWRVGQADIALGASGLPVLQDLRGTPDRDGRPLAVSVRALADEIAAAADLVAGKSAGIPAAVVRGLPVVDGSETPARELNRPLAEDWFSLAVVEAIRHGLGVADGDVAPPPLARETEPRAARLERIVQVATTGRADTWKVQVDAPPAGATACLRLVRPDGAAPGAADLIGAGELRQRLITSAVAEDEDVEVEIAW